MISELKARCLAWTIDNKKEKIQMNDALNTLEDNIQDLLIDIKNNMLIMEDVKNELVAMINFIRKVKVENNI